MTSSAAPAAVPPAEGWMEVFSLVSVEGQSVPDAAAKLRLSPEKVRHTREQVLTWIARKKPLLSELTREEGRRLSEVVARERLEHLYSVAMNAWEESQEDEITTRQEGVLAKTTRVVKRSHSNIAYLNLAGKISEMLVKIPIHYLPGWLEEGAEADAPIDFQLDAGERYEREQQRRHSEADHHEPRRPHPPVRDCSDFAPFEAPNTAQLLDGYDAMLHEVETSAEAIERFRRDPELRARLFSPVQLDEESIDEADDELFAEVAQQALERLVRIDEPRPTLQPSPARRPLNRKERKARQRLLAKAKKKRSG